MVGFQLRLLGLDCQSSTKSAGSSSPSFHFRKPLAVSTRRLPSPYLYPSFLAEVGWVWLHLASTYVASNLIACTITIHQNPSRLTE